MFFITLFFRDNSNIKQCCLPFFSLFVFGAGKRVCVGEQLALNRLFLITASFSKKFTFYPASDCQLPSSDPRDFEFGAILKPPDYFVRAVPRSRK